jgi:predicted acylesterase/phospholipase RssA
MRKTFRIIAIALLVIIFSYIGISVISWKMQPVAEAGIFIERKGTAIAMTGAAARIVQEVALLEELQKTGWLRKPCFISGTSSGALNTVMLNAILAKKFSWKRYHNILFNLKSEDVFTRDGNKLPLNTDPLKKLLISTLQDSLGFDSLGSLPFPSSISITDIRVLPLGTRTYRMSNIRINKESDPATNLVDVLMASTAIPVLFPPVRLQLTASLPTTTFIDGGVAEDHIPYQAVIQYEKYRGMGIDTLIIVSRKCDTASQLNSEMEMFGAKDKQLFEKIGVRVENMAREGFLKQMKELQANYPELAEHTYVYIPDFEENFHILDFNQMKEQYEITTKWAKTHKPVPLNEYLKNEK